MVNLPMDMDAVLKEEMGTLEVEVLPMVEMVAKTEVMGMTTDFQQGRALN